MRSNLNVTLSIFILFISSIVCGQTTIKNSLAESKTVNPTQTKSEGVTTKSELFKDLLKDPYISARDPRKYILVSEEKSNNIENVLLSPRPNGNSNQLYAVDYRSKIKIKFDIESLKKYKEFKGFLSISAKSGDRNIEVNPYFITGNPQSTIGISSNLSVEEVSKVITNIMVTGYQCSSILNKWTSTLKPNFIYEEEKDKGEDFKRVLNSEFSIAHEKVYSFAVVASGASTLTLPTNTTSSTNSASTAANSNSLAGNSTTTVLISSASQDSIRENLARKALITYTNSIVNNHKFPLERYLLSIPQIEKLFMTKRKVYENNMATNLKQYLNRKNATTTYTNNQISLSDIYDVNSYIERFVGVDSVFPFEIKTYNLFTYIKEYNKGLTYQNSSKRSKSIFDLFTTKKDNITSNGDSDEKLLLQLRMNLEKLNLLLRNNTEEEINTILIHNAFHNVTAYKVFMENLLKKIDESLKGLDQDNKLLIKDVKNHIVNLISLQKDLEPLQSAIADLTNRDTSQYFVDIKRNEYRIKPEMIVELEGTIWKKLAEERFERLLTATIDLSKQDLSKGDYLNIYVNWDNSDINKDPKAGALPLELVKLKIIKIGWFPEISESFLLVRNIYSDGRDPKTSKGVIKGQYGVNFFATWLPDPNKNANYFQFGDSNKVTIEKSRYKRLGNIFKPSIGVNLSYLDFSDETIELGVGAVIGLFKNKIHLTGGYNLFVPKNPWYFGVGFSFVNLLNFFPKNDSNSFGKNE